MAAWFPNTYGHFYLVKNCKIVRNLITPKAIEKISADLESLEVHKNLKPTKFYLIKLIKLATDFYQQPSYLLGEKASLKAYAIFYFYDVRHH